MDNSKLFKDVDPVVYEKWFERLEKLRVDHPSYRDDQLLMFLLCTGEDDVSQA